ncbi:MAG: hypothetical protein WBC22_10875 [Sedimentisphaerales bacterium]
MHKLAATRQQDILIPIKTAVLAAKRESIHKQHRLIGGVGSVKMEKNFQNEKNSNKGLLFSKKELPAGHRI